MLNTSLLGWSWLSCKGQGILKIKLELTFVFAQFLLYVCGVFKKIHWFVLLIIYFYLPFLSLIWWALYSSVLISWDENLNYWFPDFLHFSPLRGISYPPSRALAACHKFWHLISFLSFSSKDFDFWFDFFSRWNTHKAYFKFPGS